MSIQILSPQAGAVFTTAQSITLSGINGPPSEIEIDPPGQDKGGPEALGTAWTTNILPITTPGDHTIRVHGPGGRTASVVVTIIAAQ